MGISKSSVINHDSSQSEQVYLRSSGANGEASKAGEIFRKTDLIELAAHGD